MQGFAIALQHHIEPEGLGVEQAGDLRSETVLLFEFGGELPAICVRVSKLDGQLVPRLFFQIVEQSVEIATQLTQGFRQLLVG